MEKRSLGDLINKGDFQLAWIFRLKIRHWNPQGLPYLHKDYVPHLLHRDVKSRNVLLDNEFEPKLTDLALDTILGENAFRSSLDSKSGSSCYIAPDIHPMLLSNIDLENEDVVFGTNAQEVDEEVVDREDHVVEDIQEAETIDKIDASDERMRNECIDFDEFDSVEDHDAPLIVNNRMRRSKQIRKEYKGKENIKLGNFFVIQDFPTRTAIKEEIRMYALESRRAVKVKKYDSERVTTYCHGLVVSYGKGKHVDDDGRSKQTCWQNIISFKLKR
ncbi:probably inactive leucine-rich repeat receptor-like protein kinase [Tanacetum coccineum]